MRVHRFLATGLIFSLGALVGGALTLGALRDPRALLAGVHSAALEPSASARGSAVEITPAVAQGSASRGTAEQTVAGSARQIAREARAVTAMVTGGGEYGAGIVIDSRHILTCLHVVERMKTIEVSIAEGPRRPATIVDRDAALDAAILHIGEPALERARFASVTSTETGDRVYAMGAPRRMGFSLSSGIASYVGRTHSGLHWIQTDLPINGGSSGGPLLDTEGRVIGMTSFILKGSQGLAFALPIDYAERRFARYFRDRLEPAPFESWLASRGSAAPGTVSPGAANALAAGMTPPAR